MGLDPRAVVSDPVRVHDPEVGSKSSAEARGLVPSSPPTTSTSPFERTVAVWLYLAVDIVAAAVHLLEDGS